MRRFCFYKRGPIWYAKLYNPANGPIIDQTFIDAMAGGDGTSSSLRQPFDFLGYTCGPCYAAKSSAVYLGAKPSKRRIKRLYGKIREQLNRGNNDPSQDVVAAVNRILVGWSQYFSYGTLSKAYRTVDYLTRNRLRWWLCRRHKVKGRGTRQFPGTKLHSNYGLVCLSTLLAAKRLKT